MTQRGQVEIDADWNEEEWCKFMRNCVCLVDEFSRKGVDVRDPGRCGYLPRQVIDKNRNFGIGRQ